jgi:hypothetical protein
MTKARQRKTAQHKSSPRASAQDDSEVAFAFYAVVTTMPGAGQVWYVMPPAPGTALGSICARASSANPIYDVHAKVYADSTAAIPSTPPLTTGTSDDAVRGIPNVDNTAWTWCESTYNQLHGTNFYNASPYPMNRLVIWHKISPTGTFQTPKVVLFYGRTGTAANPCGGNTVVCN